MTTFAPTTVPDWDEIPKLRQLKVDRLFAQAEEIVATIADLEAKLKDIRLQLAAKFEVADVKSVRHDDFVYTYKEGYERRTFDAGWAKKTLVRKGVSVAEIEKHYKVTPVPPTMQIGKSRAGAGTASKTDED